MNRKEKNWDIPRWEIEARIKMRLAGYADEEIQKYIIELYKMRRWNSLGNIIAGILVLGLLTLTFYEVLSLF